ncbi:MAG: acyl carrier protein [Acidobacteriaceae bacterium]|jgi:acyl carrier protein|nr:acyl carrier protein [Acidobacteriaceae bacterium]
MGNRSPVEAPVETPFEAPVETGDQDGLLAVRQRVRQIAADLFAVPVDGLTEESSPDSIGSWDSLNHLNLVLALEQEWGIQFSPEEMEELLSMARIARVVAGKLGEG